MQRAKDSVTAAPETEVELLRGWRAQVFGRSLLAHGIEAARAWDA